MVIIQLISFLVDFRNLMATILYTFDKLERFAYFEKLTLDKLMKGPSGCDNIDAYRKL